MAEPKSKGKPVSDILARWASQSRLASAPTIAPASGEPAPALNGLSARLVELRDEMASSRLDRMMEDRARIEMEADAAELESRKLETEVKTMENKSRLQELKDKLESGGSSNNNIMTIALLEMLQQTIVQNQQPQAGSSEVLQFVAAMQQQLADLREEIKSRRVTSADDDKDPITRLTESMQAAVAIQTLLGQLNPKPAELPAFSAAERDLDTTLKLHEIELSHQQRKMEIEMSQERWRADITYKERELQVEERRGQMLADSLKTLAQTLQPVIGEVAQMLTTRGVTPTPVSDMVTYAAPMNVQQVPVQATGFSVPSNGNGHEPVMDTSQPKTVDCPNCEYPILLPAYKSVDFIECPHCGHESGIDWDA